MDAISASDGQKLKMLFLHETQDQFFLKKLKVECTHLHVLLQFQNIQNQKIYKFLSIWNSAQNKFKLIQRSTDLEWILYMHLEWMYCNLNENITYILNFETNGPPYTIAKTHWFLQCKRVGQLSTIQIAIKIPGS